MGRPQTGVNNAARVLDGGPEGSEQMASCACEIASIGRRHLDRFARLGRPRGRSLLVWDGSDAAAGCQFRCTISDMASVESCIAACSWRPRSPRPALWPDDQFDLSRLVHSSSRFSRQRLGRGRVPTSGTPSDAEKRALTSVSPAGGSTLSINSINTPTLATSAHSYSSSDVQCQVKQTRLPTAASSATMALTVSRIHV